MWRILCLPMAATLGLSGCFDQGSTLDASDGASFRNSVAQMRGELSPLRAEAFGDALFTLSFQDSGTFPAAERDASLSALARDPDALVAKLRRRVDGLTADEIISAARTYKLTSIEGELTRLNGEIERWAGYAVAANMLLRTIAIRTPRYYWRDNGLKERAVIEFTIVNNSPIALKRINLLGNLQSPGREIPWAHGTFSYTFPGGLEPGESQQLKLLANTFGAWSQDALRDATDAELDLTLVNVRDSHDTPLIPTEVERLDEMRGLIGNLKAEREAILTAMH
ncbi:DUF6694 family lipoprotein [Acuticoccus sediminis]|uniref:DUF6694 family lipoprotein n=1 Tax=Acuticoccus sediminis TaxID=2184697 RepID=UPI001CFDA0C2|nr:DUF6694 family lipoprotein [Acuticoccus sediminis]